MDKTIEIRVGELLRQRGLTLAAAESCTGGLVGHCITNVPGSSDYYLGSVTAYAYEAKVRLLGVKWSTLDAHGAVSDEVVLEMAAGVREALGADVGISISGIAGPSGGTPEKPVGLVYFGMSILGESWSTHHIFEGERVQVKEQAAEFILGWMVEKLSEDQTQ
jgi:PncC family amidohydrolase